MKGLEILEKTPVDCSRSLSAHNHETTRTITILVARMWSVGQTVWDSIVSPSVQPLYLSFFMRKKKLQVRQLGQEHEGHKNIPMSIH